MLKTDTVLLLGTFHEGRWFFKVSNEEKKGKRLICSLTLEEPIYFKGVSTPEAVARNALERAINHFRDSCRRVSEEDAFKAALKARERVMALEKALACCQEVEEPPHYEILCLREILEEERLKFSVLEERASRNGQITQFKAKKMSLSGESLLWDSRYSASGEFRIDEEESDVEF
nr:hypothetical protein MarFTME_482 [Marseillevirus futianmevirus]